MELWQYWHVGSISINDMVAKPLIDIMFGVKSLNESKLSIDALVKSSYNYWPYKADNFNTHHLHLIQYESPL